MIGKGHEVGEGAMGKSGTFFFSFFFVILPALKYKQISHTGMKFLLLLIEWHVLTEHIIISTLLIF